MKVSKNNLVSRTTILVAIIASTFATSVASAQHGDTMKSKEMMSKKAMKGEMKGAMKGEMKGAMKGEMKKAQLGLEGYCPVCVVEARKWERGRAEFQSTIDGITYRFPNAAIKGKFDAAPAKYVPALGGDCTVCYAKLGKRVPGNIRHAVLDQNRLFLFPSDGEKRAFQENPRAFADVDLAVNGECIVCLAKGKHVPGKPEFTVVHNGFRYQFPSNGEANAFRNSPDQFIATTMKMERKMQASMKMEKKMDSKTSMRKGSSRTKLVSVAGMSACAGCEFGVTPIANPDELGLAVKASNGRIVVVENAHKLYPDIYAARFQGQNLQVEGEILKTDGKIAWLQPSSVRVVN